MQNAILLAEFMSTPWALVPERLGAMAAALSQAGAAQPAAARQARPANRSATVQADGGSIAVISLGGMLTQRGNAMQAFFGGTSVQGVSAALQAALADDTVGQILIDIDSPGGSVYGVDELANQLLSARQTKPVVGVANSMAASAAYWVGAACSELYVTPGGEVGSIGVWQAHQDCSKAYDKAGVKVTLIAAGKYKTEGNPYAALMRDAQAFMQSRVNDYYGAFTRTIAKGRGVPLEAVRNGMGQGRVLGAQDAVKAGLVDGIATIDQVVAKMRRAATMSKLSGRKSLATHQASKSAFPRLAAAQRIIDLS